ncbi:MFS transporter [Nocardioides sp.]|uniref:MFS transporter n=1 Tax=Nocardioides sp. TaxID=35761 RepID=UPI00261A138F|nr:MFS transporter [Nocardioides sp.]
MNASPVSSPEAPISGRSTRPDAIVLVLAVAGITAALMQTLVVPIIGELPTLLNTSKSNASWVITATLLAAAVATPVSGRLGDLYGKRQVMLVCAVLLVVGSVVCATAGGVVAMIVGRALQGSAMGLVPLGISAMRDLLPPEKLGKSVALMSASMGIGGALGLPISAAIAEHTNWHVLFWFATAMAVLVLVMIATLVPPTRISASGSFDVLGAVGLGAGLICFLLAVSKGADWGWSSAATISLFVAAVVILLAWGAFELRSDNPLVDLRVTARPVVLLTNVASVVIGFAMYSNSLILPQLLQLPSATGYGLGQSMMQMGLWMLPGGIMMMLISPVGAKVSAARGPKITLALGSTIVAVGYAAAVLGMGSTWTLLIGICVINAGVGMAYGAMPALIMGSVPISETASANSFNTLMRSVGTSVSAAVIGVVLAQMTTSFGGYELPSKSGFQVGLWIGAIVALVAAAIAMTIPTSASKAAESHLEHPETAEGEPAAL